MSLHVLFNLLNELGKSNNLLGTRASYRLFTRILINEPRHEISNNVVCATSKGSNQPAHTRSLIRAFASRLNIL